MHGDLPVAEGGDEVTLPLANDKRRGVRLPGCLIQCSYGWVRGGVELSLHMLPLSSPLAGRLMTWSLSPHSRLAGRVPGRGRGAGADRATWGGYGDDHHHCGAGRAGDTAHDSE